MLALRDFAAGCRRATKRLLLHTVAHVGVVLLRPTSVTVWRSLALSLSTPTRRLARPTLMPLPLLALTPRGSLAETETPDRLWDAASPTAATLVRDPCVRARVADSSESGKAERPG